MRWLWLCLLVLSGCDDESYYADGTLWKPVMPVNPGRVPPSEMDSRQWSRFLTDSGLQGDDTPRSFPPVWNGFSTDPVGNIHYHDFGRIVQVWVDSALTGVSDEAFMILTGMPSSITPSANRYVRCLLLDESNLKGGVVLVSSAGGMSFSLEVVDTTTTPDTVTFDNVFTDPSALGFKGLPSGWLITYVK